MRVPVIAKHHPPAGSHADALKRFAAGPVHRTAASHPQLLPPDLIREPCPEIPHLPRTQD
jgi:hypothetical protein